MSQWRVFFYSMMLCAIVGIGGYMLFVSPYKPSPRARAEGAALFYMMEVGGVSIVCSPIAVGISAIAAYCLGRRR